MRYFFAIIHPKNAVNSLLDEANTKSAFLLRFIIKTFIKNEK